MWTARNDFSTEIPSHVDGPQPRSLAAPQSLAPLHYPLGMRPKSVQSRGSGRKTELALLAGIRARSSQLRNPRLQLGIGDDCALLRLRSGEEMAVTTDLSIDGRHFRLDRYPPEAIGHRTLARGLSDLAAMGARPIAAFLSLGLPRELVQKVKGREPWPDRFLDLFLDGFFALAAAHQTPLAGGDLAESPMVVADIILAGAARRGKALLRSGARPGDLLYVTGSLGGSAAGLARLAQLAAAQKRARSHQMPLRIPAILQTMLKPHLYPEPRIAQGLWLARPSRATAAIDLSDGLSTDLAHLCEESRVAAELNAASLPIHPAATLQQALHGGEDYELLFTAPNSARIPRSIGGVPVTKIGRILRRRAGKPMITLVTTRGPRPLEPQGWEHFS
jgi:thiamine-monophosphate kinase